MSGKAEAATTLKRTMAQNGDKEKELKLKHLIKRFIFQVAKTIQ